MKDNKTVNSQRRNEILQSGVKLFAIKGYDGLKTVDFADASNMSLGLMYHYYKDKKTLYNEVISYCLSQFNFFVQETFVNQETFFMDIATFVINDFKKEPIYAYMFLVLVSVDLHSKTLDDKTKKTISDINESTLERSVDIIQMNQKKGIYRQGNPDALAKMFWGAIESTMKLIVKGHTADLPCPEWLMQILTG